MRTMKNNVLFLFDSIINVDFGLLKLIKTEYNNSRFMMSQILNNDDNFFRLLLLTAEDTNPLKLVLNEESKDQADSLLSKFMNEEYYKILKYSEKNTIYTILHNYIYSTDGAIDTTVLCTNQQQQQYISNLNHEIFTVVSKLDEFDITNYDAIFVKDIRDLLQIKNVTGKSLYILNYRTNFDDEEWTKPLGSVIKEYGNDNIFNIADVYADLSKPLG